MNRALKLDDALLTFLRTLSGDFPPGDEECTKRTEYDIIQSWQKEKAMQGANAHNAQAQKIK